MRMALVALLACVPLAAQGKAPAHDAMAYLPRTKGTTWVYAVEIDGAPTTRTVTKHVTRALGQGERVWLELAVFCGDPTLGFDALEYLGTDPRGIVAGAMRHEGGVRFLDPVAEGALLLATPVGAIAAWQCAARGRASANAELLGLGVPLELPAGRFEVVRVRIGADRELAFARGYGPVQEQFRFRGRRVTLRLRAFQPGADAAADLLAKARKLAGATVALELVAHPQIAGAFESVFFRVGHGVDARLVRVWRGAASWFDPRSTLDLHRLVGDEGLADQGPRADRGAGGVQQIQISPQPPPFVFAVAMLDLMRRAPVPATATAAAKLTQMGMRRLGMDPITYSFGVQVGDETCNIDWSSGEGGRMWMKVSDG